MVVAASLFLASLLGLALLFTVKAIEAKRGSVYASEVRSSLDDAALSLKAALVELRHIISRIPPALVYVSRIMLHELALGAAKLARLAEAQSHKIADLVSHKRSFEKRPGGAGEPSEFLKQVGDRTNGGSGEDGRKEL